jgi:hypothetical protein
MLMSDDSVQILFINKSFSNVLLSYKNEAVLLYNKNGGETRALGNFVKCGGRTTIHHNKPMPSDYVSIAITSSLQAFDSLPFPQFDHDPPLLTIKDAMGYVVLWPWKLIDKYMKNF